VSRFDVLVADILLGDGMDGIELARQVMAVQPWLSVVLMSGYDADQFELDGLPRETQFLTKPFSTDTLMQCLIAARDDDGAPSGW
jgi:CheY-like chemotaxis protein